MGFSRQEYWMGCHFFLQGIFPTQRLNSCLLLYHWRHLHVKPLSSLCRNWSTHTHSCPSQVHSLNLKEWSFNYANLCLLIFWLKFFNDIPELMWSPQLLAWPPRLCMFCCLPLWFPSNTPITSLWLLSVIHTHFLLSSEHMLLPMFTKISSTLFFLQLFLGFQGSV